jgi:tRNA 2-thiouridine synthesizing protein A
MSGILVDARGHRCPVPSLRLRRALARAAPGTIVTLLADDPLARIDVPHLIGAGPHRLLETATTPEGLRFSVETGAPPTG